jgi:hypothetical protein
MRGAMISSLFFFPPQAASTITKLAKRATDRNCFMMNIYNIDVAKVVKNYEICKEIT